MRLIATALCKGTVAISIGGTMDSILSDIDSGGEVLDLASGSKGETLEILFHHIKRTFSN